MPGTYSQLLFHIVFSTKQRERQITPALAERLYPFIGGTVRNVKGTLLGIGGVEDHVHLYLRWRTDESLSSLMRNIKARSGKWIHESMPDQQSFAWQDGYAAFSVSKSQEPIVQRYVANQAEHHHVVDFKTELLKLLYAYGIEFDERYVFD